MSCSGPEQCGARERGGRSPPAHSSPRSLKWVFKFGKFIILQIGFNIFLYLIQKDRQEKARLAAGSFRRKHFCGGAGLCVRRAGRPQLPAVHASPRRAPGSPPLTSLTRLPRESTWGSSAQLLPRTRGFEAPSALTTPLPAWPGTVGNPWGPAGVASGTR